MTKTSVLSLIAAITLVVASTAAYAAESDPKSPSIDQPEKRVQSKSGEKVEPLTTNCWTNQQGCAGFTRYGPFTYAVGCALWYNDGRGGVSNFTLQANQSREERVQYNDTGACVGIQYAPPNYNGNRYYLWVHN
jgi:hypothetical protein